MNDPKNAPEEPQECDCTHDEEFHDLVTGACMYVNIIYGPCPCAATPEATRKAQGAAQEKQREVLRAQGYLRS